MQKFIRCAKCTKEKEAFSFVIPEFSEEEKCKFGFIQPPNRNYCSQKCQDKNEAYLKRCEERKAVQHHYSHDDGSDDDSDREERYRGRIRHRDDREERYYMRRRDHAW
jgi:hypothetical protein